MNTVLFCIWLLWRQRSATYRDNFVCHLSVRLSVHLSSFAGTTCVCGTLVIPLARKVHRRHLVTVKRGHFRVGVIFAFFARLSFSRKLPHAKIKPKCLYVGNRSSIVKITPTWNVLRTFSRNFPPAKITTFTVLDQSAIFQVWMDTSKSCLHIIIVTSVAWG